MFHPSVSLKNISSSDGDTRLYALTPIPASTKL